MPHVIAQSHPNRTVTSQQAQPQRRRTPIRPGGFSSTLGTYQTPFRSNTLPSSKVGWTAGFAQTQDVTEGGKSRSVSRKTSRVNEESSSPGPEQAAQRAAELWVWGKPSAGEREHKARLRRDAPTAGNTPGRANAGKHTAGLSSSSLHTSQEPVRSVPIRNRTAYFQVHSKVKPSQLVREQDTFCDRIMKLFPFKFHL